MNAQHPSRGRGPLARGILTAVVATSLATYALPAAVAAPAPPTTRADAATLASSAAAATPLVASPTRTMVTSVAFAGGSSVLTTTDKKTLTKFVRSLPKTAYVIDVRVRGYVPVSRAHKSLAVGVARARTTTTYLKALKLSGPYHQTATGVTTTGAPSRRAIVTLVYRIRSVQTLTFAPPASLAVGRADVALTATSSSHLAVSVASLTPATCTVLGRVGSYAVHAVATGTCNLRATQAGNGYYLASTLTRTMSVAPRPVFTVTYDYQQGIGTPANAQFTLGGPALTLPTATRLGYTLDGWFDASSGGTLVGAQSASYTPTAAVTLYARWTAVPNTFVVTYDLQYAGNTPPARLFTVGGQAISLPLVLRTGYTFDGWFAAPTGGTEISSPYTPGVTGTLYAHWTANVYTVTYHYTSGTTAQASDSYTVDGTPITLPTTTRVGYVFAGWFTAASSGDYVGMGGDHYPPIASGDLYAQWTPGTYSIVLSDAHGGSGGTFFYTTGGTAYTLPTPTATDYTFNGWYDSPLPGANLLYHAGDTLTPSANITLWAQWTLGGT
jgi:uncharacterized repeat protein (TIGR02543 family)